MEQPNVVVHGIVGLLVILTISANWTIFDKAGEPGWLVLVPIYGAIKRCQIAGRSGWEVLLMPLGFPVIFINYSIMRKFDYGKLASLVGALFPFVGMLVAAYSDAAYSPYDPPARKWPPIQHYESDIMMRLDRNESITDISWLLLAHTNDLTRRDIVEYIESLQRPMLYGRRA